MWVWPLFVLGLSASVQQLLGVLGAAGITAGGAWFLARRSSSGSISTSDAATLWEAAEQIRTELREEVVARREENVLLRAENVDLKAQVVDLTGRLTEAEGEIKRLRKIVGEA